MKAIVKDFHANPRMLTGRENLRKRLRKPTPSWEFSIFSHGLCPQGLTPYPLIFLVFSFQGYLSGEASTFFQSGWPCREREGDHSASQLIPCSEGLAWSLRSMYYTRALGSGSNTVRSAFPHFTLHQICSQCLSSASTPGQ